MTQIANDGRTHSERKYNPIRRVASRYGKIEKVLQELKDEGKTEIDPQLVAKRVKILDTNQVIGILRFTNGVEKEKGKGNKFRFNDEEIRVDN